MKRRRALATVAAALGGVAGCAGDGPGESTPTPTATSGTPIPGAPEDVVVGKAVTYSSLMGSGGVLTPEDRQFVVASLGDRDAPDSVTFTFETDGNSWDAGLPATRGASNAAVADHGRPSVAFTVPSPLAASSPRIRRSDGTAWPLSAEARDRLAAPAPRYELDNLTVPDRVSQGEPMPVELAATNVSETGGRFLAAIYWPTERIADDDESRIVDRTVAADESVTATLDIDTAYTATEAGPVTLSTTGHVSADREVGVEDVDTDA